MLRRAVPALLLVLVVGLASVVGAQASRAPTEAELEAITAATEENNSSIGFSLPRVRISDEGDWAISIIHPELPPSQAQDAEGVYRLVSPTRWRLVMVSNEVCFGRALAAKGMLKGTSEDLDIPPCSPYGHPKQSKPTRACGRIGGVSIHAHNLSCKTARRIYRANMAGRLPAGWSCSASLARCYRGEVGGSDEYLWWRRTTYRLLSTSVVLGGKVYGGPYGRGWGAAHPATIYNGGDASGSITEVHWSSWDGPVAHGRGRHPIFKPRGGYYRHSVVAQLKAIRIGSCEGRQAYLRLLIREPRRPGGPLDPWRSWSGPQTICEPYGSARR